MKTLNTYIAKNLFFNTTIGIGILTFVMLSANLLKAFQLLSRGVPFGTFIMFFIYLLPDLLTYSIPLSMLISSVLVYSRLSADNEITAMRASGISIWQIIAPGLMISIILSIFCLWLHASVGPNSRFKARQMKRTIGTKNILALLEPGQTIEYNGMLINLEKREGKKLFNIEIYKTNEMGKFTHNFFARTGTIITNPTTQITTLSLNKTTITELDLSGNKKQVRHIAGDKIDIPLNLEENGGNIKISRRPKYMPLTMLTAQIKFNYQQHKPTSALLLELNSRLCLALSPLAFLLLGIPFGIKTQRSDQSAGLLVCLGLALAFYTFLLLANSLKREAGLHPEILVWIPNAIYQIGGIFAISRIAKR